MRSTAAEQIPGKRIDISAASTELRKSLDSWDKFSKVRRVMYYSVQ